MIPQQPARRRPDFSLATINIVFLLLLFFLVAGSLVQRNEQGVQIPLAEHLSLQHLPRPVLVLSQGGVLYLDGAQVAPDTLIEAVSKKLGKGEFLNILADRDLPAQQLLDLIDLLSANAIPARIVTVRQDGAAAGSSQ